MPLTNKTYEKVTGGRVGLYPGLDCLTRADVEEVSISFISLGNEFIARMSDGSILYSTFETDDD